MFQRPCSFRLFTLGGSEEPELILRGNQVTLLRLTALPRRGKREAIFTAP